MSGEAAAGFKPVRLAQVQRGPVTLDFAPDGAELRRLARDLAVVAVSDFTASVRLAPWLDGAAVSGSWRAVVTQTCGLSLDDFDTPLSGEFLVHVVPSGSLNAPDPAAELLLNPEADDPPDVLEGQEIDVAGYVVEHLALEIEPFPRKPGAEFAPPAAEVVAGSFAALARLKDDPAP